MASLLRSGSVSTIFSGLRRVLTPPVVRHESLALQKARVAPLSTAITRLLSSQRPAENVSATSSATQGIDRALYRIDTDIRRTGRIFLRDVEDIFTEIKTLRHASSTQSLLLLRCCGSLVPEERPEVRNRLVQDIWNTLQELGVSLDISHYNTLLRVYLENSHKFSPTDFLALLEKKGVEPNRVTYQRLIARYCEDGDIEGATKILEFMKEKQLPVGENIFNTLITGHARANDLSSAWSVLDVMRGAGLEPTTDSYAALLVAHAEAGDAEGLDRTLRESEAAELAIHDHDLLEAVYTLATHGHPALIPQVMAKLQRQFGYGQDAMNVIYRLLNAGCHEVAHQVFYTMRMPQPSQGQPQAPMSGSFYIRHLVKSGTTPMTKVVEYCQELKAKGLNLLALETALNSALTSGRPEEALFLMRVMRDEGHHLRTHYFWPLFLHYSNAGDTQKVFDTAREMVALDIPVTQETLRHYVFPGLASKGQLDLGGTIAGLKEAGLPVPLVVNGVVAFLLEQGDAAQAATLLSRYRVRVRPSLRRELSDVYIKSGQTTAAVSILGQMLNFPTVSVAQREAEEGESVPSVEEEQQEQQQQRQQPVQQDTAAMFLIDLTYSNHKDKLDRLLTVLQEMEQRGIGISVEGRDAVCAKLSPDTAGAVLEALDKLCSNDLTFQPLSRPPQDPYNQRSSKELEQQIVELQNKNLPTTSIQTFLLLAYIREKNVEKAEALRKSFEAEGIPLGVGVHVLLMDMYVGMGELDKAVATLDLLVGREPDVKLLPHKYLRLALLMAQQGRMEDVVKLVEHHAEKEGGSSADGAGVEDPLAPVQHARRLVDYMTEEGAVQAARQVLELLLAHKVVQPSSLLFGPFIKAHLNSDDVASALKEFESVCQTHRLTPYKQELTTRCINLEDGESLQKIMDLSIQVHGELNSLYDMVFAFVECGKVQQARKLVETPGLRAFNTKLDQKCQWLIDMGKVEELASLVSVTKNIFDINRDMMYLNLLRAYVLRNDPEKALGVWTTMQEDDHQPSDAFLIKLGKFLQASGREVPFAIPESSSTPPAPATVQQEPSGVPDPSPLALFRLAIRRKDWTAALHQKKMIEESGARVTIGATSELVEGLVASGQLDEATDTVMAMAKAGNHPVARVFKYFLLMLANHGRVEDIKALRQYINDHNLGRRLNFDNLLCTAHIAAGRVPEALQDLAAAIKDTPDSGLQDLEQRLPRGGLMGILEKQPEHLPQVMELADQYAARGIRGPANCVWMHFFSMGQVDEANQIYQKHLKTSDSMLMFRGILNHAEKTNNTSLPPALLQVLDSHPGISSVAKGIAYNSWISILCGDGRFEEGQQVLDSALKTLHISELSHTSLRRLKEGVEQAGKVFPYTIPAKESRPPKQAVSSSSSDSD